MARKVKLEGFFRFINNKQKQKENTALLLSRKGELVTNNAEKKLFSPLYLLALLGHRLWGQKSKLMQT